MESSNTYPCVALHGEGAKYHYKHVADGVMVASGETYVDHDEYKTGNWNSTPTDDDNVTCGIYNN